MQSERNSVHLIGWSGVFARKQPKQAPGPLRHDASTISSARLWLIRNMPINI